MNKKSNWKGPVNLTAQIPSLFDCNEPTPDLAPKPIVEVDSQWTSMVRAIAAKDKSAIEELYCTFGRGLKILIGRRLGYAEAEDHVHEVFLITIASIQNGELRNPECLPSFIHTVARRRIAQHIQQMIRKRQSEVTIEDSPALASTRPNPEAAAVDQESIRIMHAVLQELHPRDREILKRFYLAGESREEICAQMNLTETQFRLLKSRAKTRFGTFGRRKLAQRASDSVFQRIFCSA
jgi:RNA polymerase sigma factor (sigma-70 family)